MVSDEERNRGFLRERWDFWKWRFGDLGKMEILEERTREIAR